MTIVTTRNIYDRASLYFIHGNKCEKLSGDNDGPSITYLEFEGEYIKYKIQDSGVANINLLYSWGYELFVYTI